MDGFYIYDYFTMTDKSNLAYEDPLNMPDTSKIEFLKLRNKVIDDVLHVYAYYVKKYEITINGSTDLNEILPQEINPSNITWESEDPNIATVNQSGVVSVIREGQTNIIAKDQNGKIIAICHVFTGNTSESSIPIQSITLKEDWVCVNINDTLAFDFFDIVPANANEKIQFESSKPVALSVGGETITGKKAGFSKLTIKSESGKAVASIPVCIVPNDSLVFVGNKPFVLSIPSDETVWDGEICYGDSLDSYTPSTFTTFNPSENDIKRISSYKVPDMSKDIYYFYLRGNNNTYIYDSLLADDVFWLRKENSADTDVKIGCYGDIRNLLSCNNVEETVIDEYALSSLFANCEDLVHAPDLPIDQLTRNCYYYMFHGCTKLKQAPELPSMKLAEGCYSSMFSDCTSLVTAPSLPATTLADECYYLMFSGCTNLVSPPALPSTQMTTSCYSLMFEDCSSLTTPPALPATILGETCYNEMFSGCENLNVIPELPAEDLPETCYSAMFYGCKNIKIYQDSPTTSTLNIFKVGSSEPDKFSEDSTDSMLENTGGDFVDNPEPGITYRTPNAIVLANGNNSNGTIQVAKTN